ncbi:MAG: hypothetical protein COU47_01535 [Candidatus Niyogibacteria bacterium CG10_big_fil_rev_8_21_14_0_10_46_36]|uniref:Uncharacterized protein n=1 Tax=Candidatus Niyogibacteria bacterium CG10_big_fil_rev_8_21_14_0_10_46_36 TaxID=1974726 RepID=A0A2H0TDX7_9BACT|nr:MAG: hypothetical protein COU47_01535 [Candidatus Niyogibacteria bacterium CG10_big_fil_rev_8_21_14_0_10_46_36]
MEEDIQKRLDALEQKIHAIYVSVEKTRKYFLIAVIVSIVVIALPLIGLIFAIPSFLSVYDATSGGL